MAGPGDIEGSCRMAREPPVPVHCVMEMLSAHPVEAKRNITTNVRHYSFEYGNGSIVSSEHGIYMDSVLVEKIPERRKNNP